MRTRLLIALSVLVLAAAAVLVGGVFREGSSAAAPAPLVAPGDADSLGAGFGANASTATLVGRLETAVAADPRDGRSRVLLGLAYQQRARETGDPAFYARSERALRSALELDRHDALAVSGLGALALSRHRFREALALGRRAVSLAPSTARHYGVLGDALVELGRYREAFRTFDRMNMLRPSLSSYARVSYGRELIGDTAGAIDAMRLAVDAATASVEPTAWAHVQLGKLFWNHGRLRAAAREYRYALAALPGYPYALDALAQVQAAQGRLSRAISLERRAVTAVPLPQYVGALGDYLHAAGHDQAARDQYALVGAIERLLVANGVRTDLEIALFDVDHGIRLQRALGRARLALRERPSIDGEDVLGWALTRNGRCREALPHAMRALRLGTQDALKLFHRGMAERCVGRQDAARQSMRRALALNPHFSVLWTALARRVASS